MDYVDSFFLTRFYFSSAKTKLHFFVTKIKNKHNHSLLILLKIVTK